MDYKRVLEQAVIYIEQHLNEALSVEEVSKVTGYSYYHLNRQFIAILGESIGSYIKKRRLANAAQRLLYTDDKIITIAFDNNFESAEAFSRAFKTVYKVNPSTYRRNRIHTFTSGKQRLDDEKITHLLEHINVHPNIVELPEIEIAGIRTEVYLHQEELKGHWETFYKLLPAQYRMRRRFGIYESFDKLNHYMIHEDMQFHEVFGFEVNTTDRIADDFVRSTIQKGRYAVFTHHGSLHTLSQTIDYIWGTWILSTKEVLDTRDSFELYDDRFLGYDEPDTEIDIYVAIR